MERNKFYTGIKKGEDNFKYQLLVDFIEFAVKDKEEREYFLHKIDSFIQEEIED